MADFGTLKHRFGLMLPHASLDTVAQVSAVMFWIKCRAPPCRTADQPPCVARTTNWGALMDPFGQLKQRLGVPPTTRLYTRAETRTHTVIVWPILAHKNTCWDTHWRDTDMLVPAQIPCLGQLNVWDS